MAYKNGETHVNPFEHSYEQQISAEGNDFFDWLRHILASLCSLFGEHEKVYTKP